MNLEQLSFSVNRAGWYVTKIYSHHRFEQECFKKNFILMNQRSRQNARSASFSQDAITILIQKS